MVTKQGGSSAKDEQGDSVTQEERKGGSTTIWIAMFVVVLILWISSVAVGVICYTNVKNAKSSSPQKASQKDDSQEKFGYQGKTRNDEDNYMALNPLKDLRVIHRPQFGRSSVDSSNQHPKEGGTVDIFCLSYDAYIDNLDLVWSKDGDELTRNGTFIDELGKRPDIDLSYSWYESYITIGNVSRRDSGNYTCSVHHQGEKYPLVVESVILNVLYYPKSEFPLCSVKPETPNSQLALSCLSEIGNPAVSVDWEIESAQVQVSEVPSTSNQEEEFVTSEITITSTQIRSKDVFTCSLNSSEFSISRKCSLHGYSILYAIHVIPSSLSVDVFEKAEYSCKTNLTHVIPIKRVWVTEPEVPQSRRFFTDSTLRIAPVLAEDNGTLVTCFALFESNNVRADAILWVNHGDHSSVKSSTMETEQGDSATQEERKGESTTAWIAMFVVVLILWIISIAFGVIWYRKVKKLSPKASSQKGQVDYQGKTETDGENYMDLSPEQRPSEVYTDLNLEGAVSTQYANKGCVQETKRGGNVDVELYDYPEDDEVYLNI
ncbi:uncharacterized protein [Amphiura filiformis]|uniref:uncharacterized protein n=1 Tax=Amphiura filiformis TaxID=82378 RepID=UPI003B20BF5D